MDVWGSFLTDTSLKIPTSLWFFPDLKRFRWNLSAYDQYANLAVFLCASCLDVLSTGETSYSTKWRTTFDLLETWYNERPLEMLPITTGRQEGNATGTFPSVLFTNPCATSGNQLYYTAALLMVQSKPRNVRMKSHKSMFWHARHIVGITASNPSQ